MDSIFISITAGIILYAITQLISKFFLEQYLIYYNTWRTINRNLSYHGRYYFNSGCGEKDKNREISDIYQRLSTDLCVDYVSMPFKQVLINLKKIPDRDTIKKASEKLIFLSNGVSETGFVMENIKAAQEVADLLGFPKL